MKSKEEITKQIKEELESAGEGIGDFGGFEIVDVVITNGPLYDDSYVLVKFSLNVVPDDDYYGLCFY